MKKCRQDAIKHDIKIFKLVDINSYIIEEEYKKLKEKSFVGNN